MSTSVNGVRRSKIKGLLALATSFLVAVGGLAVAPAAVAAEEATVSNTVTVTGETGISVNVSASGLPADVTGIYAALALKTDMASTTYAAFAIPFPVVTGGVTNFTLNATVAGTDKAQPLVKNGDYEVVLWKQHDASTPANVYARGDLTITNEQWNELFPPAPAVGTTTTLAANSASIEEGESVALSAAVAPAEATGQVTLKQDGTGVQTVAVAGGKADFTVSNLDAGTHSFTAEFAPADASAFEASSSTSVSVEVTALPEEENEEPELTFDPQLTVTPKRGLDPEGQTVTVSGEGYNPEQGIYVFLCEDVDLPTNLFDVAMGCRDGAKVVNAAGSGRGVQFSEDGSFELDFDVKQLGEGATAVYTAANHTAQADRTQDAKAVLSFGEIQWNPSVEVFLADGVTPYNGQELRAGDKLVVHGTDFDPESNIGTNPNSPIAPGQPQGTFAVFGIFAENWKPSEQNSSSTRVMHRDSREWAVSDAVFNAMEDQSSIADSRVVLTEDGAFTATVELHEPTPGTTLPADGIWGIYTYAGGVGTINAAQEIRVPVNFVPAKVFTPSLTVTPNADIDPKGQTVTVSGEGYNPEQGIYVFLCEDVDLPTNLFDVAMGCRDGAKVVNAAGSGRGVQFSEDGSFELDFDVKQLGEGATAVYTAANHTAQADRTQDAKAVLTFADEEPVPAAGSLFWGVRESFVNYIENIAGGKTTLTAPATRDGKIFIFPQSDDKAWDSETETGSILYAGAVNFNAHGGVLNLTLVNPQVEVVSSTEGLLKVEFENQVVTIATLDLSVAKRTENADGTVTWAGATSALTAGGVEIFGPSYKVGEALDPVTFSAGSSSLEPILPVIPDEEEKKKEETDAGKTPATPAAPVEQCVAREVIGGSMSWGLKERFKNYVEGRIAKGTFTNTGFSASGGALNPDNGGIGIANFAGSINANGHGGVLNYSVSNPSIQITGPTTGILYATAGGSRVAYANLYFSSLNVSGSTVSGNASATITGAGSATFGEFAGRYPAGTALDSVSFSVTLGGEVECDNSTDPVKLAETGTPEQGTMALMGIAAVMSIIGAALLGARRRNVHN